MDGERQVHGNASFKGNYVVRAAESAARNKEGLVILHSHPRGRGWQGLSSFDLDAEASFAYLVHAMTGLPLMGMTLAGRDQGWSARAWTPEGRFHWLESVRVIDDRLRVTWNDALRPPPPQGASQVRTVSAWGKVVQADIARLRILVVGLGSVGLDVAVRLAASGVENIGIMDFDGVETANLDRLIGATSIDAYLNRSKAELGHSCLCDASTASNPQFDVYETSICEPAGLRNALDYDLIFSCVDRPWPRAVLNMLAYSDLIPVIDGGIAIDPFPEGGMRSATWRTHVIGPGRPCMSCNKQLDLGAVSIDREGLLDDPTYLAGLLPTEVPRRQNVAALSVGVTGGLLAQFISLVAAPGGRGDPGPLQFV